MAIPVAPGRTICGDERSRLQRQTLRVPRTASIAAISFRNYLGSRRMPVTHLRKVMLEELRRRNLSAITTRIYLHSIEEFAQYFNTSPDRLGLEHVRQY